MQQMHVRHSFHLVRLALNKSGSLLPLYAITVGVLIMAIGSAIDIARAFSAKSAMQTALDSGSTSALAHYRKTRSASEAENHLRAVIANTLAKNGLNLADGGTENESSAKNGEVILSNAQISEETHSVSPSLSTKYRTSVMGIFGFTDIDIKVSAAASFSAGQIEVAVALALTEELCAAKNTQCSTGTKLSGLKNATISLLEIVMTTPAARVAIIPYSNAVNVGSYVEAATNAPQTIQGTDPNNKQKPKKKKANQTCRGKKCVTLYRTNCVVERDSRARFTNEQPSQGSYSNPVWATSPSAPCIPADTDTLLPLSDQKSLASDYINNLTAAGQSAGHLGISWAWYTLSEEWASFWGSEQAPAKKGTVTKSVIFLADGDFTLHSDAQNCSGTKYCDQSYIDTDETCNAMKNDGITIYVVAYQNDSSAYSRKGLEKFIQCASSGKQYMASTPQELQNVFLAIAQQLTSGVGQIILMN